MRDGRLEVTDVMAGDWVRSKKWAEKPFKLTSLNANGRFYYGITSNGGLIGPFLVEELEPIPLIPEILEKIGFEKTKIGKYSYEDEDKNLTITFYPKCMNYTNGGYDYVCIRCGCVTIEELPIDYVHQLQHALRLCGIDKKIEL